MIKNISTFVIVAAAAALTAWAAANHPLGDASGDLRRRVLRHHVPLALASAVVLVLFMTLPRFDVSASPHGDIFSGPFPQQRGGEHTGPMAGGGSHTGGPMDHGAGRPGPMDHGGSHAGGPMDHGGARTGPMRHGGDRTGPMRHGGDRTGPMGRGRDQTGPSPDQIRHRFFMRQLTFATGYVALGLLALTLLIGPANLLLGRRNPVSTYLTRDVGTWAAIGSVVHTVFGLQVHGSGRLSGFLMYFVAPDGSPWTNSFGLANWTGLAALVIVVGLLAISSDAALRRLKARPWKRLQRLNYALFALVILHAFFYGALLRVSSSFTLLLGLSVVAVFGGQAVGVWLWRRSYARAAATAS